MTTVDTHAITKELQHEGSLAVSAIKRFSADQCTTLAASIAFYSAFSLAPTLLMVIAVAGWFFGAEAAQGQLFARVHDFLGNDAAAAIQAIVQNAHRQSGGGLAAVTSLVLLFVGASATFSSLNTALDVVFPAMPKEKRSGIALMVRVRLISFGLVLGVAFLLVVSLVLDTAVSFIGKMVWGDSPFVIVGDIVQLVLSLAILSLAFTALMKLLPDASIQWRDAFVGGVVSSVLFTIGKKLFALYLAHAGTASAFGAAGSLAVLLMWLYFSSAVLLLGAEFAAVKGGFGARKDATAAAVAAAGGAPALGAGDQDAAADAHEASAHARGGLAGMVPAMLRQGTASRLDDTSGRRADVHADRTGRARAGASASVAKSKDKGMLGMDLLDELIGRTKHPAALRLAVRSAPLLLRGASFLMPKKKRKPTRPVSLLARLLPLARAGMGSKAARSAAVREIAALGAAREAEKLAQERDKDRAKKKAPGRYPLTAALFAAGAGLLVASMANRDGKSDAGPLGDR